MAKNTNNNNSNIEKVDKITFSGEIVMRERVDEDTKEVKRRQRGSRAE